jgi:hypothetical protein
VTAISVSPVLPNDLNELSTPAHLLDNTSVVSLKAYVRLRAT